MQKTPQETILVDTQEGIDWVLSMIKHIDQPLNTQLSSILQIVCMLSSDTTLVEYLLEKGANPNYLDIRGWNARRYATYNQNTIASFIIQSILKRYEGNFPKQDPNKRSNQLLELALKKDGN